jgi:hypothetical protein
MHEKMAEWNRINGMRAGDYSPEKAGVGGSTPSLATIVSSTYLPTKSQSRIKTLQFTRMSDGICLNGSEHKS